PSPPPVFPLVHFPLSGDDTRKMTYGDIPADRLSVLTEENEDNMTEYQRTIQSLRQQHALLQGMLSILCVNLLYNHVAAYNQCFDYVLPIRQTRVQYWIVHVYCMSFRNARGETPSEQCKAEWNCSG